MKVLSTCGRFTVGLSIIFLFVQLIRHFREIPDFISGPWSILSICFGVAFSAIAVAVYAYIWVLILRGGGVSLPLKSAFITLGQAQIGKYLPGNIFHYVGRFILGRRHGVPDEALVLSMGVETLLVIVTAMAIGAVGLFYEKSFLVSQLWEFDSASETVIFFIIISLAALSIILLKLRPGARAWIRLRLPYLHVGRVGISALLYILIFSLYGLYLSLLPISLWGVDNTLHWYTFTWGFALSWVMGFITPAAPGGIGVREAFFVLLFSKDVGPGLAVGLILILRVVTSLGDLVAFGFAHWLRSVNDKNKGTLSNIADF